MSTPASASESLQPPPHIEVLNVINGYMLGVAMSALADLDVPDLLASGPKTCDELGAESGADPGALYRILRLLTAFGYFEEDGEGRFRNGHVGDALRREAIGGIRPFLRLVFSPVFQKIFSEFTEAVRTGTPCAEKALGMPVFEFFSKNPEAATRFNEGMVGIHGEEPAAIAHAYDFAGIERIIDVGGGTGNLITTILAANPALRGVLYDLPHVVAQAQARIDARGVAERCEAIGGSFFEEVPPADAYLLSHVLHDWKDDECRKILGNCLRGLRGPEGRVLVIEAVVPEGTEFHPSKIFDLVMLAMPGGKERTEAEYAALFRSAGLRLSRVIPTTTTMSVIEALPA